MKLYKLLIPILCLIIFVGCIKTSDLIEIKVEAEVLSINTNILRGKLIGMFLGSSSGSISNDINIVGVKFNIGNELFLEDLKVSHAILSYYSESKILPLKIKFLCYDAVTYTMLIKVHSYVLKTKLIDEKFYDSMMKK